MSDPYKYHATFDDASYSSVDIRESLEGFYTVKDAKLALWERYAKNGKYKSTVDFVRFASDGQAEYVREHLLFPTVTENAKITLYHNGQYDVPAYEITFGPRMGVNVTKVNG